MSDFNDSSSSVVAIEPTMSTNVKICGFFQKSNCTKGESCKYSHVIGESVQEPVAKECNAFANGNCRYGDNCTYSHTISGNRKPCDNYSKGTCTFGNRCRFSHTANSGGAVKSTAIKVKSALDTRIDNISESLASLQEQYLVEIEAIIAKAGRDALKLMAASKR